MKQQMKQRNRSAMPRSIKKNTAEAIVSLAVYADSREVLVQYYTEKIAYYQTAVNRLNVIDNAREIVAVCQEMNKYRQLLKQQIGSSSKTLF